MAGYLKPKTLPELRGRGLVSPRRVRDFLDMTDKTLHQMRRAGHLRAVLLPSGRVRYRLADVLAIAENLEEAARTDPAEAMAEKGASLASPSWR